MDIRRLMCVLIVVLSSHGCKEDESGPTSNLAPVVEAGPNASVTLPDVEYVLQGSATDDGLPGEGISFTWSQTGGPDAVVFGDATDPSTTVTLPSIPGQYTLQLTACDEEPLCGSDTMTLTLYPESGVAVSLVASRTSGVAPLYVHFDATGTVASGIEHPFHELGYVWDFDDTGAGTWTISGRSKESATGAIAAHVFDLPGTYTVRLTVFEPSGSTSTDTVVITVEDPDDVYSGENTVCVSNGDSFDGCPAGALQVGNTNDFGETLSANIGSGKRVLFRRGDTFQSSTGVSMSFIGPSTVGAFGSGELPVVNADTSVISFSDGSLLDDARIMDLDMRGSGSSRMMGANDMVSNILIYRVRGTGFHQGIQFAVTSSHTFIAAVDCDIEEIGAGSGGNIVYATGDNMAWLGNRFVDSMDGEHVLRLSYSNKTVVAHNHLEGAADDKLELTMRCEVYDGPACRYWIVSDNTFVSGLSEWISGFGNGSAGHADQTNDVIIERNYYRLSGPNSYAYLLVFADEATVRNNILDLTGNVGLGVSLQRLGDEGPHTNNWAFNNTCYSADDASEKTCVRIDAEVSQSVAANNLLVAPGVTTKRVAIDGNGANTLENNLSVDSPAFATEPPTEPSHFALTGASIELIDQGSTHGQACGDFMLNQRCFDGDGNNSAECDVGAFEYGSVPFPR